MKKFLTASFIVFALVVGATGAAPVALAQVEFDTPQVNAQAAAADAAAAAAIANGADASQVGAAAQAAAQNTAANIPTTLPQNPDVSKGFGPVMIWIMSLFAWLVGVAAMTLDYAVYYTVITMGDYVHRLSAIGVSWRILRDIANIMLIFGFLGAGLATILNVEKYGWGTKMLPMLLLGAVFLNFSLFISEAMIDGTNLFATEFYAQINGGKLPTPSDMANLSPSNEGISNKIMNQLGLQTIYGEVSNTAKAQEILKSGNSWIIGFMGILLFLITAFVMFSLAFILIARFVALVFFLILSPVGFMGLAIPQMKYRATQWWTNFLDQIVVAPVLILLLYVALAVITDAQFLTGLCVPSAGSTNTACTSNWLGYVDGNLVGFASMLISFFVAMGLLLVVVIKAKNMSAFGAKLGINLGGKLSFGSVSLGGRATFGSLGNVLASKRMQSLARRSGASGLALKGVVLAGKGLRSSTYDLRNAPGAASGLGAIGVDAGKGATLTAKQVHDAQYGVKPVKEWLQHSKEEREQAGREIDFKKAQADLAAGKITNSQFDAIATPILSKMTGKQLEELGGIRKGTEALVRNLSPEQFESLMKSDKFNEVEKEKMRDGRYSSLHGAIAAGNRDAVRQWSAKDLATAAPDILDNPVQAAGFVSLMSEGQFDAVVKNDKLTKTQQQQLRDFSGQGKIDNYLDIAGGRPPRTPALVTAGIIPAGMTPAAAAAEATRLMGSMSPKKLAKLPGRIFTDPRSGPIATSLLTPKHLAAFMTDGDLDPGQISAIAAAVRNPTHPNHAVINTYLDPATNPIAASYWV